MEKFNRLLIAPLVILLGIGLGATSQSHTAYASNLQTNQVLSQRGQASNEETTSTDNGLSAAAQMDQAKQDSAGNELTNSTDKNVKNNTSATNTASNTASNTTASSTSKAQRTRNTSKKTATVAAKKTPKASTRSAIGRHDDNDFIYIPNNVLKERLQIALGVPTYQALTYRDIHTQNPANHVIYLDLFDFSNQGFSDLTGLEALRELPSDVSVQLQLNLKKGADLTPISGLRVSNKLVIRSDGLHDSNLEALNSLNFVASERDTASPEINLLGSSFYGNREGLANTDLIKLDALFTKAKIAATMKQQQLRIDVSGQALSDFSYFQRFGNVDIKALGEVQIFNQKIINVREHSTAIITDEVKGLAGEAIQNSTTTTNSDTGQVIFKEGKTVVPDAYNKNNDGWLVLSQKDSAYNSTPTYGYANGSSLQTDGIQYHAVSWKQAAANVIARYVDAQGNAVANDQSYQGTLGEVYQTTQKNILGYTFKKMAPDSASTVGNFTDEIQEVTYIYQKANLGKVIAAAKKTTPRKQVKVSNTKKQSQNVDKTKAKIKSNNKKVLAVAAVKKVPFKKGTVKTNALGTTSAAATPTASSAKQSSTKLPQTNEAVDLLLSILGLLVAAVIGYYLIDRKEKIAK